MNQPRRAHRRRTRRDTFPRAPGTPGRASDHTPSGASDHAPGRASEPIVHFGGLCRAVAHVQATTDPDAGFDDDTAAEARARQDHFVRLLALAARLDLDADGSGHALRRSLCLSLQQQPWRVDAARAQIESVDARPPAERVDLHWLLEDQLIVGFGDRRRMTAGQCRQIHALLAAAAARHAQRLPSNSSARNCAP